MAVDKFEEYKLFVEDTARFSERRQTISNTYIAVNSVILSAIAFIVKDAGFLVLWRALVIGLVLWAGIVICRRWNDLILQYKKLVNFRIFELRVMEDHADMQGSHKMYHKEDKLYPRRSATDPYPLTFMDDALCPCELDVKRGHPQPAQPGAAGRQDLPLGLNFSDRERRLPSTFIAVYLIFLLGLGVFLLLHLYKPELVGGV